MFLQLHRLLPEIQPVHYLFSPVWGQNPYHEDSSLQSGRRVPAAQRLRLQDLVRLPDKMRQGQMLRHAMFRQKMLLQKRLLLLQRAVRDEVQNILG